MSIFDNFRVDGEVALLVGAGKGMGAASALALAEAGADVVIAARTQADLEATAARIKDATGTTALTIVLDAYDSDQTKAAVDRVVQEFGRLNHVVSIVGGTGPGPFLESTDESWSTAFQGNVINGLRVVRQAVPHMLASGGGGVVMISTGLGHVVGRGWSVYGAAKAALEHAVRMLAVELNPRIRVNAVAPGATATDGFNVALADPGLRETLEHNTPLHRIGTSQDIAAGVLYLLSPAGSYLTGHILPVDGGLYTSNLPMNYPDL